jgi:hypothetical protein
MEVKSLIAMVAGGLAFVSYVPYFVSIFRGGTQPSRVTWWIWTLQGCILLTLYYRTDGISNIWVPLADVSMIAVTAVLAVWYGVKGFNRFDALAVLGVGATLVVWFYSGSLLAALYFAIVIDACGALPTFHKAYYKPHSETPVSWGIFASAALLNVLVLPDWHSPENAYPVYLFCLNSSMCLLIIWSRWRRRRNT